MVATLDEFVHQIRLPMQVTRNEVILQENDEIHDYDYTNWPDQLLAHSNGTDREIVDEHHTSTEQSLIKRALAEDGLLERMTPTEEEYPNGKEMALTEDGHLDTVALTGDEPPEHYTALQQLTPPLTENGKLEDFVGLTVRNPVQFGGVENRIEDGEKLKPPNRADDNRFQGFKDTKSRQHGKGLF
ncbi:hypothetical protein V8E54_005985 [Elaphomyces granulatus]